MEPLAAVVQHYAWGDTDFIARLQGRLPSGHPEAELWMGAHPRAPSRLASGRRLDEAIAAAPERMLGTGVAERFGELPFLAKVLAAATPLSIQAHPSRRQARAGFARENAAGIDIDAAHRTYRDENHKPELICALTRFEAKCGFRPLADSRELFDRLDDPGLDPVREALGASGSEAEVLAATLQMLLTAGTEAGADIADATVRASARLTDGRFATAAAWSAPIADIYPGDPGVTVALLLHHVVLEPGDAVFLGAGNLHAYLRGSGIELMANSDNVVRGGLTPKHVDVDELLRVVDCSPISVPVQTATTSAHTFDTPVPEFTLTRLSVDGSADAAVAGPEIVLATEGTLTLHPDRGEPVAARRGHPVWVPASDSSYRVTGTGVLFRACVGDPFGRP